MKTDIEGEERNTAQPREKTWKAASTRLSIKRRGRPISVSFFRYTTSGHCYHFVGEQTKTQNLNTAYFVLFCFVLVYFAVI